MMKEQQALEQIARSLKEISVQQQKQTRILEALNQNLVEMFQNSSTSPQLKFTESAEQTISGVRVTPANGTWIYNSGSWERQTPPVGCLVDDHETGATWRWSGTSWEKVEPYDE